MHFKHISFILYLVSFVCTAAFRNHRHFKFLSHEPIKKKASQISRQNYGFQKTQKREEPLLRCIPLESNFEVDSVPQEPESVDLKSMQKEPVTVAENKGIILTEEKEDQEEQNEKEKEKEEVSESSSTSTIEDPLERFMNLLKQYVNQTHFNVGEFDRNYLNLKEKLSDINFSVHIQTLNPELRHQLKFVKHVFQVMEDASLEYAKEKNTVNPLAFEMIELNVRALLLHDSHANPEKNREEYEERALSLLQSVSEMRQMFENHIIEAEIIINSLVKELGQG